MPTDSAPLSDELKAAMKRAYAEMVAEKRPWPKRIVAVGDKLEGGVTYCDDGTSSEETKK
jgi:hypothetical protein